MNLFFKRSACLSKHKLQGYVAGTLSPKERLEAEDHLLDCALCQAAVDGLMAVQLKGSADSAKEDLEMLERKYAAQNKYVSGNSWKLGWWLLILAALLAAVAAWLWFKSPMHKSNADRIYAMYFVPATNEYVAMQLRGKQEKFDAHPALEQAMQYYDAKQYAAAINYFEQYLLEQPNDGQAALYEGIALMELRQLEKAIDLLEQATDTYPDHSLAAHWYLALAHLLNKDNAAARSELQYLMSIDSPYKERAAAILAQL